MIFHFVTKYVMQYNLSRKIARTRISNAFNIKILYTTKNINKTDIKRKFVEHTEYNKNGTNSVFFSII